MNGDPEPPSPVRDRDLRFLVVEHEVRPGDELWRALVELQRRRDREEAPRRAFRAE